MLPPAPLSPWALLSGSLPASPSELPHLPLVPVGPLGPLPPFPCTPPASLLPFSAPPPPTGPPKLPSGPRNLMPVTVGSCGRFGGEKRRPRQERQVLAAPLSRALCPAGRRRALVPTRRPRPPHRGGPPICRVPPSRGRGAWAVGPRPRATPWGPRPGSCDVSPDAAWRSRNAETPSRTPASRPPACPAQHLPSSVPSTHPCWDRQGLFGAPPGYKRPWIRAQSDLGPPVHLPAPPAEPGLTEALLGREGEGCPWQDGLEGRVGGEHHGTPAAERSDRTRLQTCPPLPLERSDRPPTAPLLLPLHQRDPCRLPAG